MQVLEQQQVIREEEEEEEEDEELYYLESQEQQENDPYFFDNNNQQVVEADESFYLANKTFYTTCHKISRQNSPTYRKKPPYSLLENWLIHSVFSKSQQILLRFPVIHPRVMMAEGDFIYTPHQVATENQDYYYDQQNFEEEDDDYDYYDDTFIIGDEGVMVMSASAPDASHFMAEDIDEQQQQQNMVMDENMWMGHSRLHVVNPDLDEEEQDPMYHSTYKPTQQQQFQGQQLQAVKEEDEEEEEEEEDKPITMSPEVLEWYRSKPIDDDDCGCSSQQEDQTSDTSTRTDTLHSDEKSNESYTSLAEIMMEEESSRHNYGTLDRSIQHEPTDPSPLLQVSACFVDAAWVALDIAQAYVEQDDKRGISGFITYMFRIWKVLFLGAETMLGWGHHRTRPQTVV